MLFEGHIHSRHAVICLHGFTQSASDCKKKLRQSISNTGDTVFFFPSRKWFTYKNDTNFLYDRSALYASRKYIHKILNLFYNIYDSVKLIGYSQGACVALDAALTYARNIPVLCISGFIMNYKKMEIYDHVRSKNIWVIHGKNDSVISLDYALQSFRHVDIKRSLLLDKVDHWEFWKHTPVKKLIHDFISQ